MYCDSCGLKLKNEHCAKVFNQCSLCFLGENTEHKKTKKRMGRDFPKDHKARRVKKKIKKSC